MALVGNTVKVQASFFNFANALIDPTVGSIFVKFYDSKMNVLSGPTLLTVAANKVSTGIFVYNYTIPVTTSPTIIYEFVATVDAVPSLNRGVIPVRWV